jgi:hypothetical protein
MSTLFPLKETVLSIRDHQIRVRELTHAKKMEISQLIREDRFRGPALWASACCVDPVMTEEQAACESAEIIDLIAREGMRLCGIDLDEQKTPNAEAASTKS